MRGSTYSMFGRKTRHIASLGALMLCLGGRAWADSCVSRPCTLPCTATGTAAQILPQRTNRTDLVICDTDPANLLYVILGTVATGPQTTGYGIPVPASNCIHFGVGPNPQANVHTYTTAVSIVTTGASVACTYTEKAD